jgi:hypothetical protein
MLTCGLCEPNTLVASSLRPHTLVASSLRPHALVASSLRPHALVASSLRPHALVASSSRHHTVLTCGLGEPASELGPIVPLLRRRSAAPGGHRLVIQVLQH